MKFLDFLNERDSRQQYKKELNEYDYQQLLKSKCSNININDENCILYRGMSGTNDYYLLDSNQRNRTSADTSNHYTVIFEETFKDKLPLRSKSIVCANYKNINHTKNFGSELYKIIPFNDTKIGVTVGNDIWDCKILRKSIEYWNNQYKKYNISDKSFESIVRDLEEHKKSFNYHNSTLHELLSKNDDIAKLLIESYNPDNLKLYSINEKEIKTVDYAAEMWFSGKALAIKV